jgi:methionine-rich copper-binding protein CopC
VSALRRLFVLLLALLASGPLLAHAELSEVEPGRDAVLAVLPETVTLGFTEPVVTAFSLFKVYPLPEGPGLADGGNALLERNGRAAALVSEVLQKRADEAERADTGLLTTAGESPEVVISLKADLPPGDYVIMWRVLSVDTHSTSGFAVFTFAPAD